jgi:hypothetical protein
MLDGISRVCAVAMLLLAHEPAIAQTDSATAPGLTSKQAQALLDRLDAQEARIHELESKVEQLSGAGPSVAKAPSPSPPAAPAAPQTAEPATEPQPDTQMDMGGHTMELPGGAPALKIRGFFDMNFGVGSDANPLIYPLGAPAHTTYQLGEFDLFVSSRLSNQLSFLSEIIIGSDATNFWGFDIERAQLTYRPSEFFEISGGRYHVSIGYYNTTFHHGTWFQTATGRPFMYFFEDSGGILPVHGVGATMTGLIPRTGKLDLHWIAEMSNGRSSSPAGQPVQNFMSDKNGKAANFALYSRPQWIPGLQVGGSYYRDRLYPLDVAPVNQWIGSIYAAYTTPQWEVLNEAVMLSNHQVGFSKAHVTPLAYTQLSHRFGRYHPYVRYQYVNSPLSDPVNVFVGRYSGPSVGVRMDVAGYAAFKTQYNRLNQGPAIRSGNGLDMQMAFTF